MKPVHQPKSLYACIAQFPRLTESTYPLFTTSCRLAGLPTTILFDGTPLFIIYYTEVPGK